MPPALCLDLTRALTRVGRGPLTGVDRVERAYADWALEKCPEARFLVRTSRGFILFGAAGARAFFAAMDGARHWPRPDLVSRLTGKGRSARHGAERVLRQHAIARCLHRNLFRMLSQHLVEGTVYLNTGHSNLSREVLGAFQANPDVRVAVFLHDLIPLTTPQFAAPGVPEHFRVMMGAVAEFADHILCNSQATAAVLREHFGPDMPITAAHLGLPSRATPEPLPFALDPNAPRFVALGTIEPRKNHALLLDVWDRFSAEDAPPHLHIVGRRGWADEALLARLSAHPLKGRAIFEHGNLSDGQVATLLDGARALLFPSFAEGFGYPPLEALRLGVPSICSDLPVFREILGDCAVYLAPENIYSWMEAIMKVSRDNKENGKLFAYREPDWPSHFACVAAALWPEGQEAVE